MYGQKLIDACKNGNLNLVKEAIQNGANIHAQNDFVIRLASFNGHLAVVKFLVKNGADIHADNDAAIRWASENGHLDVVNYLESIIKKEEKMTKKTKETKQSTKPTPDKKDPKITSSNLLNIPILVIDSEDESEIIYKDSEELFEKIKSENTEAWVTCIKDGSTKIYGFLNDKIVKLNLDYQVILSLSCKE